MQRLSAEKILAVWEAGRPQHALDRALTILAAASPEASREALADLSIGERDARLLQLRTLVLGPRAEGFAECPRCAERVEFPLDTAAFTPRPEGRLPRVQTLCDEIEMNGSTVRFRLPTSRDLAEVVAAPDSSQGLRRLVASCVFTPNELPTLPDESCRKPSAAPCSKPIRRRKSCSVLPVPLAAMSGNCFSISRNFSGPRLPRRRSASCARSTLLARAYGWTEREILRPSGAAPANLPGAGRRMTHFLAPAGRARSRHRAAGRADHRPAVCAGAGRGNRGGSRSVRGRKSRPR